MKINILPADTYLVVNKTILNDCDRNLLVMLYQPLMGSIALNLYFTLWSDLDQMEIMSIAYTHHHLMAKLHLKLTDIIKARQKLEALGLLKVYYKEGSVNNYIYQLYSPLSASEFLNDPILNVLLYSHLGANEYNRVLNYYKVPILKLNDFKEITVSFSELFTTYSNSSVELPKANIKKRTSNYIVTATEIDFALILESIPKTIISPREFNVKNKELINKLSFLYQLETLQMIKILRTVITEKGTIDKVKLRTACRNYYQFNNQEQLPKLIYRSQPESLREKNKDDSPWSQMLETFETLSPYAFLKAKYNGAQPTSRDTKLIEGLLVDQDLPAGVVNVLLDYVLKVNQNKLNKNYIETIAGQWKRLNIKTAQDAMRQAEQEYKKGKTKDYKPKQKIKGTEQLPEWFGKDIAEEKLTTTEEEAIKAMLKEFS